ncbi:hypothetical protein BDN71DRAFT_1434145 [Pleurotus eryngii]|uniref:Uncharacterized protein n=1 Tax=Pleurotus eryngii TaxID=5323 RepID=A0A9P6D3H6_PLEER|nr:hypothetical protein BDN71DRAFT_1434145 [Pleurotus eryngii]
MPWASPEQIAYLNSCMQCFQDSIDDKSARDQFWHDLREGWQAQWVLLPKHNTMRARGVLPKWVQKPKPKKPKKPKQPASPEPTTSTPSSTTVGHTPRSPLASTSRHQHSRSSSLSVDEFLLGQIASSPAHLSLTPDNREVQGDDVAAPPHVPQQETTRRLRFQLNMPGIEHDNVRLFVQDKRLAICAHTSNVSYEWKRGLGGNVLPDHVHGGIISGDLRLNLTVEDTEDVDPDIWVFSVTTLCIANPLVLWNLHVHNLEVLSYILNGDAESAWGPIEYSNLEEFSRSLNVIAGYLSARRGDGNSKGEQASLRATWVPVATRAVAEGSRYISPFLQSSLLPQSFMIPSHWVVNLPCYQDAREADSIPLLHSHFGLPGCL